MNGNLEKVAAGPVNDTIEDLAGGAVEDPLEDPVLSRGEKREYLEYRAELDGLVARQKEFEARLLRVLRGADIEKMSLPVAIKYFEGKYSEVEVACAFDFLGIFQDSIMRYRVRRSGTDARGIPIRAHFIKAMLWEYFEEISSPDEALELIKEYEADFLNFVEPNDIESSEFGLDVIKGEPRILKMLGIICGILIVVFAVRRGCDAILDADLGYVEGDEEGEVDTDGGGASGLESEAEPESELEGESESEAEPEAECDEVGDRPDLSDEPELRVKLGPDNTPWSVVSRFVSQRLKPLGLTRSQLRQHIVKALIAVCLSPSNSIKVPELGIPEGEHDTRRLPATFMIDLTPAKDYVDNLINL